MCILKELYKLNRKFVKAMTSVVFYKRMLTPDGRNSDLTP